MRVTQLMLRTQVLADVQRALAALAQQQGRVASGRRWLTPADDPATAMQALTVRSRQAATEQFGRNIAAARGELIAAEGALRAIADTIIRAREAAVHGANDAEGEARRRTLATAVDQFLEELVSLAAARGPRHAVLFGGLESRTVPYRAERDAAGRITAVLPNPLGIDGETMAEVADGVTVAISVPGATVFGTPDEGTEIFGVLIRLRDALASNDRDGVSAALTPLDGALDRVMQAAAAVGNRMAWLETLDGRRENASLALAAERSRLEDADLVDAITRLQQRETAYQAALASAARLLPQSLLDFLR